MPIFMRKVRKARWHGKDELPWLPEGDLQADVFLDLETRENALSVWDVSDEASLDQVIAALAANCDRIENLDFVLIHTEGLPDIKIRPCVGESVDGTANEALHMHLEELTVSTLVRLVKTAQLHRKLRCEVLALVRKSAAAGRIDRARLKEKVLRAIESS